MTPARVLIVEDERIVARDIQNRLTQLGYEVVGVTRFGEEAVRLADQLRPDLVLMDIRLEGGMDGVDAALEIRRRAPVPIVYLTAYTDDDTLRRARVTEPLGYILKPFEERELRTVIEMALYKHQAERKLRESERRYAVTLSSIGDAVIATDNEARIAFMNPVAGALTGWPEGEAASRPVGEVFRVINEHTREPAEGPVSKVLRLGTVVGLDNHAVLLARDGREVPIEDCGAPIIDDLGHITGVVLVFHDATQRRRAQEALTLFRALIDRANDAIEVIDPETGRFLDVNEKACRDHGFAREEYLALRVSDIDLTLSDPTTWAENVAHLRQFGSRIHQGQHRRKDGSVFPVEVNVNHIRLDREYLVAVVRDVTERKRAEEALRRSEAYLAEAQRLSHTGSWAWNVATREFVHWSDEHYRLHGLDPKQGMPSWEAATQFIHPEDRSRCLEGIERAIRERADCELEYRAVHPDGTIKYIHSIAHPVFNEPGDLVEFMGTEMDVTERKRAQEALRQSEADRELALEAARMGEWKWDIATGEVTWSPLCKALYGLPPDAEMSYQRFLAAVHPDDRERVDATIRRAVETRSDYEVEKRVIWPDGSVRWNASRGRVLCDAAGRPVRMAGLTMDITERKRAEEERHVHLWFLESMDQVNRALQKTNDLEQMMREVLDAVLTIFACDRAWLSYPCDPAAASWWVPMERTRPEHPGAFTLGLKVPMGPDAARVCQIVRASHGPVRFAPGSEHAPAAELAKRFRIQSMLAMAIYPKVDKPYMFGLHQCSYPRAWRPQEERLFQEIGRRLADALTSLLAYRALRESEGKLADAQRIAHVGHWDAWH
jgi:PAS domain S-box-containing protein